MASEIATYVLRSHSNDAHAGDMYEDERFDTIERAIKEAKKIAKDRAYKVEIFGLRADGSLFHAMPVRIVFGKGGNWPAAIKSYRHGVR